MFLEVIWNDMVLLYLYLLHSALHMNWILKFEEDKHISRNHTRGQLYLVGSFQK